MNILVLVFCTVLMIFGVVEMVRVFCFWWRKADTAAPFFVVVSPKSGEDCEETVRAAAERIRWLDFKGPCRLICVNREGDPEVESICRFLALRYPFLVVSKPEDLEYNLSVEEK